MSETTQPEQPPAGEDRKQQLESLREKFARIATASADANADELMIVAATLTDLMTIAQTSADLDDEQSTAQAISDYCQSTLPAIEAALSAYPETDDSMSAILDDIETTWGEYLDLLSEHERFHASTGDSWGSSLDQGWGNEGAEDDSEADAPFDPVDVSALLSTLSEIPTEEEKPEQPVEEESTPFKDSASATAPPEIGSETIDDPELVTAYLDDAQQCLASMENCLLELDNEDAGVAPLQQFCRELHTLKGASGTVGLSGLASYLHSLENDVEAMTKDGAKVNTDPLLEGVDSVRQQLENLVSNPNKEEKQDAKSTSAAVPLPMDAGFVNSAEGVVRLETSRLERLMDLLAELVMFRNRRDTYVNSMQNLQHEVNSCATRIRVIDTLNIAQQKRDAYTPDELENRSKQLNQQLRDLNSLLTEISKDVTEIGRSLNEICDPLSQDNSGISHLIGRFRSEMMELRRQPIAGLFRRLQRVAREAGKIEQKPVELILHGEGTRAERAVQDRLYEPLMHIVRNAIGHGIESADERKQRGKSAAGKIHLNSWSDATSLYVEVRDDGRGLDEEKLERKGREMGLIRLGEQVSQRNLWNLILHPGFSTKQEANQISGRGVGMDVVASQIREMRGRLEIESVAGESMTIRMQIPLRSTIEHAMVVRVGERLFALPMHAIDGSGSDELDASDKNVVSLQYLLGLDAAPAPSPRVITLRHQSTGGRSERRSEKERVSILVDAVVGVEEVVVRTLPPLLRNHDCFSGVTMSGQAETVLVLDVPRLVELGMNSFDSYTDYLEDNTPEAQKHKRLAEIQKRGLNNQNQKILVVDDSLSVRRVLVKKLQKHGYETIEASDGLQAMNMLRSSDCVAVVSDVDMPKMNGIDFISEAKRLNRFSELPFVFVTSRKDEDTLSTLDSLGAAKVFAKPVSDSTVKLIVRVLREQSRSQSLVTS